MAYALRGGTRANERFASDVIRARRIISDLAQFQDLEVSESTTLSGTTDITGTLDVSGTSSFVGDVNIDGTLDVSGVSNLAGDVTISGDLEIIGSMSISGSLGISGDVVIDGNLTVLKTTTTVETVYINEEVVYTIAQDFEVDVCFNQSVTILDICNGRFWSQVDASFSRDVEISQNLYLGDALIMDPIRIGISAGFFSQGSRGVAIGYRSGLGNQGQRGVAIGEDAGRENQGLGSLAIGFTAGLNQQGQRGIAMGYESGVSFQGSDSIALGYRSGQNAQGPNNIAIGNLAGQNNQGFIPFTGGGNVAIGFNSGNSQQKERAVAIGQSSGSNTQGEEAVAIGYQAGINTQGDYAIAIGSSAGSNSQGINGIAIGFNAVQNGQSQDGIAIGSNTALHGQGQNSIAIGNGAGTKTSPETAQPANSIVLNATGSILPGLAQNLTSNATYIAPIRGVSNPAGGTVGGGLWYNTTTKEVCYQSPLTSDISFSGNVDILNNLRVFDNIYVEDNLDVCGDGRVYGDFRVDGSFNIGPASVAMWEDAKKLNIRETSSGGMVLDFSDSGETVIRHNSTTTPQIVIDSSGRVGIGKTPFGTRAIDISGSMSVGSNIVPNSQLFLVENGPKKVFIKAFDDNFTLESSGQDLHLCQTAGSVGIGTNSPLSSAYRLDVNQNARIRGDLDVCGDGRVYGDFRVDGSFNIGPASITMWESPVGVLNIAGPTQSITSRFNGSTRFFKNKLDIVLNNYGDVGIRNSNYTTGSNGRQIELDSTGNIYFYTDGTDGDGEPSAGINGKRFFVGATLGITIDPETDGIETNGKPIDLSTGSLKAGSATIGGMTLNSTGITTNNKPINFGSSSLTSGSATIGGMTLNSSGIAATGKTLNLGTGSATIGGMTLSDGGITTGNRQINLGTGLLTAGSATIGGMTLNIDSSNTWFIRDSHNRDRIRLTSSGHMSLRGDVISIGSGFGKSVQSGEVHILSNKIYVKDDNTNKATKHTGGGWRVEDFDLKLVVNFTGGHDTFLLENDISLNLLDGFIISSTGKPLEDRRNYEYLMFSKLSRKKQDSSVAGVFYYWDPSAYTTDPDIDAEYIEDIADDGTYQRNKFRKLGTSQPNIRRKDINGKIICLGEGSLWVCDENGSIQNGDYITTSSIPGIGMKQSDSNILYNYTVAKSYINCSFENELLEYEVPETRIVMTTKEQKKLIKETIFEDVDEEVEISGYVNVPVFDDSGIPILNEDGSQKMESQWFDKITKKITKKQEKEVQKAIPVIRKVPVIDSSGNFLSFNQITDYEMETITVSNEEIVKDSLGNIVMKTITKPKYEQKWIKIHNDRYDIYDDEEMKTLYLTISHDFEHISPSLVGLVTKIARIGCTYHSG
jgi:hypothetical protein